MIWTKIKIKGFLKNITENTKENIDRKGIKTKNEIIYQYENIKTNKLKIEENLIVINYFVLDSQIEYEYRIEVINQNEL